MTQMPSTNWKYFLCLLRTKWNTAMTAITVGAMYSGQISQGWLQHNNNMMITMIILTISSELWTHLYQAMGRPKASMRVAMMVTVAKLATQPHTWVAAV